MIKLVSKQESSFTMVLATFPFSFRFEFASGVAEEKAEFHPFRWKVDVWNAPVRVSAIPGDLGIFIFEDEDGEFLLEPGYVYRFELGDELPPDEPPDEPPPDEPPDEPDVPEGWVPNSIHIYFGGIPDLGCPVVSYYLDAKFATFGVHRSEYMELWSKLDEVLSKVANRI